ncbi:MAG: ribosome recycling factor [Dehalococcoidales bacterium]|nr:ribosome recycling factor [Dehalococcoidales bacterium]
MVSQVFKTTEEKMHSSVNVLREQLASIRTGRASPALVEHVKVDYAGTPMPLIQLAGISAPEASLLVISPWDRSTISIIEKAILKSDLGLNPSTDGNVIRIRIPSLSEERRQELIKVVHKRIEERKIIIRNLRHEAVNEVKTLEKNKEISQDDSKRAQDQLQKLTDRYIMETDKVGKDKETELMEV